jgi:hypothetical protein
MSQLPNSNELMSLSSTTQVMRAVQQCERAFDALWPEGSRSGVEETELFRACSNLRSAAAEVGVLIARDPRPSLASLEAVQARIRSDASLVDAASGAHQLFAWACNGAIDAAVRFVIAESLASGAGRQWRTEEASTWVLNSLRNSQQVIRQSSIE